MISNPHLWHGIHNPYLYTAKITLISDDGEILDGVTEKFGVRTYYIDSEKGFFLNGEYYDLHGVNYHQESTISTQNMNTTYATGSEYASGRK